jgi:uncharacterized protein YndB with AHSA1/START domain
MTDTTISEIAGIERRLELEAEPERVWRALTDEAELSAWFCQAASFPTTVGSDGWFEWTDHGRYAVRLEAHETPSRLAWRWARDAGVGVEDGPSTLVEFRLEPRPGGGTILGLLETGFDATSSRDDNVHGWHGGFGSLASHVAGDAWEAGISRTYTFRSAPDVVWRAFVETDRFRAWFGGEEPIEMRAGFEGWFVWPSEGRFALRVEAVEPVRYLAWQWAVEPDRSLDEAGEVLRTEWLLIPRPDGGTDLHLLETGFRGPRNHELNGSGWDGDVVPALRRVLGEAA